MLKSLNFKFFVCMILSFLFICSMGLSEKRKLVIWHAYAGQDSKVALARKWIDSFKEANPDIEIEEVALEHSSYKIKLNTAMAAGNPPDVFYALPGGTLDEFVNSGLIYPLTKDLNENNWKNDFLESALDRVTVNDDIYAVPIDIDTVQIWYNKKIFEKYNLKTPKTLEELFTVCDFLKSKGIIPISLGNKDFWAGPFWFHYFMLRFDKSGIIQGYLRNDPNYSFNTEEAINSFKLIQDMVKRNYFPMGINSMTETESDMLFFNGMAAMTMDGTWQLGQNLAAGKDFECGYFEFPKIANSKGDQSDVIAGVAACFAISNKCQNKDDAILFLKHITSLDMAKEYVKLRKTLECVKGAVTEETADPLLYLVNKNTIEKANNLDPFYDTAMPPKAMQVYYDTIQSIYDLSIKPEEAVKKIDKAIKDSVNRN
ncbi:MAG: raffinose/stachyose/melibiose transport system substrate-binding protein [Oceanotoga sp.]|uniref:ABC transporter substrate-binding protein n=1 Tax=Oceanotoga sp. TaxID=2108366 RepID=UPI002652364D|nr:extracellular solute-binding protein [Oceanotoga sp.]MDN5343052.1 raffinose/stachyose/melibiose transport system substrate-binding protein [Oceanotoga sp.]